MSNEVLPARNPTKQQHAEVPSRAQQGQSAEEKVRSRGTLILYGRLATRHLYTPDKVERRKGQRNRRGTPIERPGFVLSVPGSRPCCCHEMEGENTACEIINFPLNESEVRSDCRNAQSAHEPEI